MTDKINAAFLLWFEKNLGEHRSKFHHKTFQVFIDTAKLGFDAGAKWMQEQESRKSCGNCKKAKECFTHIDYSCNEWQSKETEK